ncbi:c-type cytochrome [Caldimonas thermodepolymerans]|jgi:Cytochrome c, mono- and diheme variants|uniref:Alcohol dehydrogenase n=1 Tax=Caldimonas thermodepolymerans TaxID=215580 RepID=A0A2S5T394_9BURK|nr:c-type cytochrome [Caldimonas thermodepolymerans]PPE69442.1 alcohol dehydrogenase [Caldimonas thermodepolymerans]QPC32793.1 c-type cytochrome [Caldimonas thermodepolymerans]RDI03561.1 mono/diheme cytochrome c family protein [Caldimonas thermodepolymerans]TCP09471.1 mono/diheme cytochrome c family protein [Caldimonas thermodepolymerans]UZG45659.1 cytochrome c [Caldimonas thermodepolymerans]
MKPWLRKSLAGVGLVVVVAAAVVWALNRRGEAPIREDVTFTPTPQQIERGRYLAQVGNCIACHTTRGGAPFAGGRGIETPFGTIYASNLTPDAETGLGRWTPDHFWRAMHNGRSRDGRLLYPAFPYPNYTLVTREDADALFAYLQSLPPVRQENRPHALRFPYNTQAALAVWRALFFSPGEFQPQAGKSAQWNRGAYLTRGLGHCTACHGARNFLGATSGGLELGGGLIPMQNWYAPSLAAAHEASVADWDEADVVRLLKTGVNRRASVMGPMAEVVFRSTQYLSDEDAHAMAVFLKDLPQAPLPAPRDEPIRRDAQQMALGGRIYEEHCAQCHGKQGEGAAGGYPALAGNRAVTMPVPANLIRVVLSGGYPPSTAGNPRPYGMPPFSHLLSDVEVAAVTTYIRGAWGNDAEPVSHFDVHHYRRGGR